MPRKKLPSIEPERLFIPQIDAMLEGLRLLQQVSAGKKYETERAASYIMLDALRQALDNFINKEHTEEAPPLEIKTPAERRAERKAQTVEAAKSLPQSAESLEISQPPGDRYIFINKEHTGNI